LQLTKALIIFLSPSSTQAACHGKDGLRSGPLQDMTFFVPEATPGYYIYQVNITPPANSLRLTGEKDGIIEIGAKNGILYLNGSLDWETKKVHRLQVEALNEKGERVKGPFSITINVEDINDNPPVFSQSKYYGEVRQNSRPGKVFMHVTATDRDDPTTPNAQLLYSILHHFPSPYEEILFQIDNKTGAISPSMAGNKYLDPEKQADFLLVVTVKDLAGMSGNAFTSNADVAITVLENLWKAPLPVFIMENSTEQHPLSITKVGSRNHSEPARFPFIIDQNGTIYATEPLDREEKDSYVFDAFAKDNYGEALARPLKISVTVGDMNDNPPVCKRALTIFEVQENEIVGNYIGTLHASDMDQKDTLNSRLQFRIVDQTPKIPIDNLFIVQKETGQFQLSSSSLNRRVASNYSVKVEVSDGVFATLCDVWINVIDINDQIPIFEKSDYGSLVIPEDTQVGKILLAIQANDADEPFTGSSRIIYQIEGDQNETFRIETDFRTNRGYFKINKILDYETSPVYSLTILAKNPEPLVSGIQYNSSSIAYVQIHITDVNEAPVFFKDTYIVDVFENVTVGTFVTSVKAYDPEGAQIRYMLISNSRNWLRVDSYTGDIYTTAPFDREIEKAYIVQVVATEQSSTHLLSTAQLILHLKDVNDNPPSLVKNSIFFCYPLSGGEKIEIEATDPDEHRLYPKFIFSLGGGETIQNDWIVHGFGVRRAHFSPKHPNLQKMQYSIPLKISDNGNPPLQGNVNLQVNICECTEDKTCFVPLDPDTSRPTVAMAVGILVGVLLVIGKWHSEMTQPDCNLC
uniref:Cadherin 17 n=1 Tax=Sphenodon punctatus TaxID=8508 RepID=A0A8D0HD56_SPHPU